MDAIIAIQIHSGSVSVPKSGTLWFDLLNISPVQKVNKKMEDQWELRGQVSILSLPFILMNL